MSAFSERLTLAVREWGSTRGFIAAMRERGVPGKSEPAIYRYLRGEGEPGVTFLQHAADVLGVSLDWLISGRSADCSVCALRERRVRQAVELLSQ